MTRTARQKALRKARRTPPRANCPTPEKRAYTDTDEAIPNALHRSKKSGKPLRIYLCQCGNHHLTARVPPKKAVTA